jgi:uncharacterized protein YoxC
MEVEQMVPSDESTTTIPINLAEPGQVLANDVHNKKGQKVVSGETELTEKLIKRLVGAGISRVEVYGDRTIEEVSDEEPEPTPTESSDEPATRQEGSRTVIEEDLNDNYVGEDDVVLEGDLDRGAVLSSRGDVDVLGEIRDGTVRAMSGDIQVEGTIKSSGNTVQLISSNPIEVSTVVNSSLSVQGHLIVNDYVENSSIECLGNLIVHGQNAQAVISGSDLEVEGQVLADQVRRRDSGSSAFSFRDPDVVSLNRKRRKTNDKLEDLNQEAEKLKNVVDTVKELGDQVKSLPPEKKEKIKKRTEEYQSVQKRIQEANDNIEQIEEQLETLRDERRYFMRVLDLLQADTSIEFEDSTLNVDNDEQDVRLYKKGMIVIQDASDLSFELEEWLAD